LQDEIFDKVVMKHYALCIVHHCEVEEALPHGMQFFACGFGRQVLDDKQNSGSKCWKHCQSLNPSWALKFDVEQPLEALRLVCNFEFRISCE
jgi:hypothetical protein